MVGLIFFEGVIVGLLMFIILNTIYAPDINIKYNSYLKEDIYATLLTLDKTGHFNPNDICSAIKNITTLNYKIIYNSTLICNSPNYTDSKKIFTIRYLYYYNNTVIPVDIYISN